MKRTFSVSLKGSLAACAALAFLSAPVMADEAPAASVVIEGRFFDGFGDLVEKGEIVIAEGRIKCAARKGRCRTPRNAERVKVEDGTILPGLVDLHVHARQHYIGAFVPAGVTSIRDANNQLQTIAALRADPNAPRIFASGPMLDGETSVIISMSDTAGRPGEQPWDVIMPVLIASQEDARNAVGALKERNVDVIKLYEQLPPEAYRAGIDAARRAELPTMTDLGLATTRGLSGAQVDALQAAEWGVSSIEHLSGVALAYQRLGGDPLSAELDGSLLDQIADRLAASGVAVVPTTANAVHFAAAEPIDVADVPMADIFEPMMAGWWRHLHDHATSEKNRPAELAEHRLQREMLPRLAARGVTIGVGTDTPAAPYTVAGGGVHQELSYLVEFGLSLKDALRAATGDAARILGRDDIGVIRKGAVADLIAVGGDPFKDIRASRHLLWVMFKGVRRTPDEWKALAFPANNEQSAANED